MNICLLKMYMTGSMFIKFGKCTKSVPLPNCDEMHHLLTCYASPQVKRCENGIFMQKPYNMPWISGLYAPNISSKGHASCLQSMSKPPEQKS